MPGNRGKRREEVGKPQGKPRFRTAFSHLRFRGSRPSGRCRSASRRRNLRPCVFYAFFCGQSLFRIFHNVQAQRRLPYTGCPALLLDFLLVQPPTIRLYHTFVPCQIQQPRRSCERYCTSGRTSRRTPVPRLPFTPSLHCSNTPFPYTPPFHLSNHRPAC